jgi:tRNA C32,U32 (ribose-2'-O)-methylase TrmJ
MTHSMLWRRSSKAEQTVRHALVGETFDEALHGCSELCPASVAANDNATSNTLSQAGAVRQLPH